MDQKILFAVLFILFLSLVLLIPVIFPKKNGETQKDSIKLKGGESGILQKNGFRVEIKVKEINQGQIILEYLRLHKIYLKNTLFYEANDLLIKAYPKGFFPSETLLRKNPNGI